MSTASRLRGYSLVLFFLTWPFSELTAQAFLQETFAYLPAGGDLLGQAGGTGFSGPWAASGFGTLRDSHDIAAGSLAFEDLAVMGNRVTSAATDVLAGLARNLEVSIPAGASTTVYVGLLLRPEGILGQGLFNGFFGVYLDGTTSDLFVGKPGSTAVGQYALEQVGGAGQVPSGLAPVVGQTVLLVVRADLRPGADTFTLYVSPDPRQPEPASGTVKSDLDLGAWTALGIYSTGAFSIDELRLGSSFEEVTPCSVREAFDYSPGALLVGQSGGTGFARPWAGDPPSPSIAAGSLEFQGLAVAGNRMEFLPMQGLYLGRTIEAPIDASATTTAYFSFLLRPQVLPAGGYCGAALGGTNYLFMGVPGGGAVDNYVLEDFGGSGQVPSGIARVFGETALLVVRVDLRPGVDTFTLHVNPDPCQPEPAQGTVRSDLDLGGLSTVGIGAFGAFSIDQLRLGSSFEEVTPCPVREAFDYSPGVLLGGQSGGTGFAGPWAGGDPSIAAGSLEFQGLAVAGNRMESLPMQGPFLERTLEAPVEASATTTAYFSFLLRPQVLPAGGYCGALLRGTNYLFMGVPGGGAVDNYVLEDFGGSGQVPSGIARVFGETALLVVRVDLRPGVDTFTLHVNPDPCQPEPAQGTVRSDLDLGGLSAVGIVGFGAFSIDELRLGSSFEEVTPCPVREPFTYAPGADLLGQAGGPGFAGPWVAGGFNAAIHDSYGIAAGSLTFQTLAVTGNRVKSGATNAIAGLSRLLARPVAGGVTTTAYFSLLVRPEGVLGEGALNGFFGVYLDGTTSDLFIGKPGSEPAGPYVLESRGGTGQVRSEVAPVVGQTVLLVVRADFQPGVDTFTLHVSPDPCQPEPASGTVKSDLDLGELSALVIYSTGAFSIDELRLGSSFEEVTPCSVREVFDYSPGALLVGQSGGTGFAEPWAGGDPVQDPGIAAGSLEFQGLAVAGNRMESLPTQGFFVDRTLEAPIDASATTTAYFSFLLRPQVLPAGGYCGAALSGTNYLFMGVPGGGAVDNYVLEDYGGSGQVPSGIARVFGETALLVVRVDLRPGVDTFTLHVNPDPCQPEPAQGTVRSDLDLGGLSAVAISGIGAFSIDELRLASSFEEVVQVGTSCVPPGGAQRPSDSNQDGVIDISDGIRLLLFLFAGTGRPLPCGDGTALAPGNMALLDANGDARLDLSDAMHIFRFVFQEGQPPVLGTECTILTGCPAGPTCSS